MASISRIRRPILAGIAGVTGAVVLYRSMLDADGEIQFDPYNVSVARFGRAAFTVASIGFDYKKSLYGPQAASLEVDELEKVKCECHQRSADKLLKLCRDNGGCFVKVGQHIGALDYLLPEEYVQTMKVLHNRAPEMPLEDVYKVIKEDLQQDPKDLFETFDEKPLGTASLAQVHKATLKDGREVAVKVQHRYVKNHSFVDIYTMDFLVKSVKAVFPQFEFMWLAEEMKKNLPMELSFVTEGKNAERVSLELEHFTWLKVPEIHWKHTTERVLTMEFCQGGHINDREYLKEHKIDPYEVSRKISQMYADMIFKFGNVHCDPHPGNVLVTKNSDGSAQIVLLDHGLYSQLTHEFRIEYARFWTSILNADTKSIKVHADNLGVGQLYGLFACMVAGRSWSSIEKGIDKQGKTKEEGAEIKNNVQRFIKEIADVLALVNRDMILIFKTNDLLRAIEHSLGTSNSMHSFVQMSRSCCSALNNHRYRQCSTKWGRLKVSASGKWDQFKVTCYQVFLWMYWSRAGLFARRMYSSASMIYVRDTRDFVGDK